MTDTMLAANFMGSAAAGIIARVFTHRTSLRTRKIASAFSLISTLYAFAFSRTSRWKLTIALPTALDTAKARLQAVGSSHLHYRGPIDVLVRTARTEGIRGFYRGFGAVIVGGTPGTVMYLCSYEIAKEALGKAVQDQGQLQHARSQESLRQAGSDFVVHFSSGIVAEAVACIVYVPVDVIKERLQVQHASSSLETMSQGQYHSSWHALQTISKTEGILTLYKGYGATLLSFGSYSGLFFLFYERLLKQTRDYLATTDHSFYHGQQKVPFYWTVVCSCAAGAVASWLTSPLDMAKLRLQIQRGQTESGVQTTQVAYRGIVDCLTQSYRKGGIQGLFRGAGARVLHFAPATTVTMTAYESCRSFFAGMMQ